MLKTMGLRCSFPPYYLYLTPPDGGGSVPVYPGDLFEMAERELALTAAEIRGILIRLRQLLHWSRGAMAAFLGVDRSVLRRWETGQRKPSGAARRLIWLLDKMVREPHKYKNAFDLIVWGRGEELIQDSK